MSRPRALMIEHDPYSHPGLVGQALSACGYEIVRDLVVPAERFETPDVEHVFADPTGFDLVVPLGAPWSVDDLSGIGSWLLPELAMLGQAHTARVPILAVCFGGQAMSVALGGAIGHAESWEIGYHAVQTVEPELVSAGPWFQFHHDVMVPPAEAVSVAHNRMGVQAWRLDRTLAVQFHPEVTPEGFETWLENGGLDVLTIQGQDVEQIRADLRRHRADAAAATHDLVSAFVAHIGAG